MSDRTQEALLRLLRDAAEGGQARADALHALAHRTVFVVPWGGGMEGFRTLTNRDGLVALPAFTTAAELENACQRFGWLDPSGRAPRTEVGARLAANYVLSRQLGFLVVDVTADHALEISREELEAVSAAGRGPFSVTSSTLKAAATRRSQPPGPGSSQIPPPSELPTGALPPVETSGARSAVIEPPREPSGLHRAALPSDHLHASCLVSPAQAPLDDAMAETLEEILRQFPEVEWACVATIGTTAVLGLRVDGRLRARVNGLADALHRTAGLDSVLLDEPAHVKTAKSVGWVFYPWRR